MTQVIVVAMARHPRSDIHERKPETVYSLRVLRDTSDKGVAALMESITKQVRKYPGMEGITPATICDELQVVVYSADRLEYKTWPQFRGTMYYERGKWNW